jgi:hypothetical protein
MGGIINIPPINATNQGVSITETIKCLILLQNPIYELYVVFLLPEKQDLLLIILVAF